MAAERECLIEGLHRYSIPAEAEVQGGFTCTPDGLHLGCGKGPQHLECIEGEIVMMEPLQLVSELIDQTGLAGKQRVNFQHPVAKSIIIAEFLMAADDFQNDSRMPWMAGEGDLITSKGVFEISDEFAISGILTELIIGQTREFIRGHRMDRDARLAGCSRTITRRSP